MIRRVIPVVFLILVAFATSGCATALLVGAARDPVINQHSISYVDSAWRGDDGGLTLCFYGWPAGDSDYGPQQPYTMRVPAGTVQSLAVPAGTAENARNILAWPAAPHNITPGCDDPPTVGLPVAVQRLATPPAVEGALWSQRPLYELMAPADVNRPDPVIYSLDEAEGQGVGIIVYQHDAPLAGGARFVRLDPPYEETYEYNALIFLTPVTLVVDVAFFIGYLYLCSEATAGSCS